MGSSAIENKDVGAAYAQRKLLAIRGQGLVVKEVNMNLKIKKPLPSFCSERAVCVQSVKSDDCQLDDFNLHFLFIRNV